MTNLQLPEDQPGDTSPLVRERYLAAVVEIQTLLLSEQSSDVIIKSIMQILGKAADASRIYIHTNTRDEQGRWSTNPLGEWNAPGIATTVSEPRLRSLPYHAEFARWFDLLSRGMYISGRVADFPEAERSVLEPQGILSILVLPVFVAGTFYGFIGFDNCQSSRGWSTAEIAFLQVAAAGISVAQQRQWDAEALRRSQSSLLLILDQLPAILWTTNRDLKVISIRGSGRVDLTNEDVDRFFELFRARTDAESMTEMHTRALSGERVSMEMLRERRVFQARLEPFFNAKGAVIGVLGLALDITDRKQVEAELRKSEVALRSLNMITLDLDLSLQEKIYALLVMGAQHFEMDTGILARTIGNDFEIVEVFTTAKELAKGNHLNISTTYSLDVLQSDRPVAFEKASGSRWEQHPCYRTSKIEAFIGVSVRVAGKTYGTLSYSSLKPRPVQFTSAETEYLYLMAQWIGIELEREQYLRQLQDYAEEIARNSQALALARDQALEAVRLKSEFLATMSHEIRTPMNALIGMAELLQDTPLNAEQQEFSGVIKNSAQDLLTLINDILDLSKIEAGKLSLEIIEFEPGPMIESTTELFAARASQKKLGFMVYVSPSIPPVIKGDPVRLRQILTNLLSNAIKFTETGEVLMRVEPWQVGESDISLRFEVRDTGIGLTEVARRRLFQPFTQADGSTSRKYGGTGLGLAISRRLVELMGGEIGADSIEGLGSTFWFTAPFQLLDRSEARNKTGPLFDLSGSHILVVDRLASHREILHQYCTHWGMRIAEADSMEVGLSQLVSADQFGDPFQVALFDLSLVGMDWRKVVERVKLAHLTVPIKLVLLAAYDQRQLGAEAVAGGFAAYLIKPIKRALLFEKLGELISGLVDLYNEDEATSGDFHPLAEHANTGELAMAARVESEGTVLLVEDNPANQKLTLAQLRKLGYTSDLAVDGRRAVEVVLHNSDRYILVLMDTQMPEMDGLAATRIIRQAEAMSGGHIPIVALTASSLQEDVEACLTAGMDVVLNKPIPLEQLRTAIERWRRSGRMAETEAVKDSDAAPIGPLDYTILEEIRSLQNVGDPDLLTELIEAYQLNSVKLMNLVAASIATGDAVQLRKAIHSLRGTSGNLGAYRLAGICGDIEALAERADLTGVKPKLASLEAELKLVIDALTDEKKTA